jgi:hypothetical protein
MKQKIGPDEGLRDVGYTNRHVKSRRNPKLRLSGSHPYVGMVVPLAAQRS